MPAPDLQLIHDPLRLEKLRCLCLMDTPADPAFDRLARLAARFIQAPVALVSLVDSDRQVFKSQVGLPEPWATARQTPLSHSFCQHVVATRQPLIIADAREHPLVFDNPAIRDLNVIAYAGIPLITTDGHALGSFCVVDHRPRVWSDDEIATLTDLAASVMTEIELRGELIERRNVEAALRESYRLNDQIVRTMPDVVYIFDLNERRNTYSNRELTGVLGYTPAEIEAMGASVLRVLMHPEDLPRFEKHIAQLMLTPDNTLVEFQYRMRQANGQWSWVMSREVIFKRDEHDRPTQILGIASDVTPWVLTEQAIRENLEQLVLLRRIEAELSESLDLDQVLMTALDAALRLSGAEHATLNLLEGDEVVVAQSIGYYQPGRRFPANRGVVGRVLRQRVPELVSDVLHDRDYVQDVPTTRAQMVIPLLYRERLIGALNLETSKPDRFRGENFSVLTLIASRIATAVDFASLYRLSQRQLEELQQLYLRVSELEQLKTDMIRIAAHDLRNPLSGVVGFTELLLDGTDPLTDDQRDMLGLTRRAANKMQKIVTDILSLERVEQASRQHETISLTELVQHAYDDALDRAKAKSLEYRLSVPEKRVMIEGDDAQFREAVENLIGNAIKYTQEGGAVRVNLSVSAGTATFEVEDTGIGIPEDQQARLFQPFFRASSPETNGIEGTGLGLHLVKNIVERHGGQMRFHSVYGKGSCFGFRLAEKV